MSKEANVHLPIDNTRDTSGDWSRLISEMLKEETNPTEKHLLISAKTRELIKQNPSLQEILDHPPTDTEIKRIPNIDKANLAIMIIKFAQNHPGNVSRQRSIDYANAKDPELKRLHLARKTYHLIHQNPRNLKKIFSRED